LTLVYAVLVACLFYTPMRGVILNGIMGLPAKLSTYATPGVYMVLMVVIVWGYSSLFRGLLSAMRRTHVIAGSALIRLLVVIAVGSVTLIAPDLNGAAVGVAAIGCAFLAEVLILGSRLIRYNRTTGPLFPRETQATVGVAS
jgi:O-antigen/teichoic acid export membrane protein